MSSTTASPAAKRRKYANTIEADMMVELVACRQVTPPSGGFRKISVKSYSPLSSPESDVWTEFPEVAESVETLEMAGFTAEAAKDVFGRFERVRDEKNGFGTMGKYAHLAQVARHYIRGKARELDASSSREDYREAWGHQGLKASRIEGALNPELDIIRLRKSASEHFVDTVNTVTEYVFSLARKVKDQQATGFAGRGESPSPSHRPSPARRSREEQRHARVSSTPIVQTLVDTPQDVPGHTIFYKGSNLPRLQQIWPHANSSKTRFGRLSSLPPTDFHRNSTAILYATTQYEVAEKYCRFAAEMEGTSSVQGILHFAIPNELLQDFRWVYGDDWKRLIWESRGPLDPDKDVWEMPSDLADFLSGFGLAGNLCDSATDVVQALPGYEAIKAGRISNGNKATQHAFFAEAFPVLNTHCEGKVWLEHRHHTDDGTLMKSTGKAFTRPKAGD